MIQETIVTTQNSQGITHIAPMGIHVEGDNLVILPFRPSTTLNNFLETKVGVMNYCDDVRVFAGCLTGRRDWPLASASQVVGNFLECALAHTEVELIAIEEDANRPKLICKTIHTANHKPFKGFNRAQFAVLEAAILISRLDMLPLSKIESEIEYLSIGLGKTAGIREKEAWGWIMKVIDEFRGKKPE
jgi:uncharacterized protein